MWMAGSIRKVTVWLHAAAAAATAARPRLYRLWPLIEVMTLVLMTKERRAALPGNCVLFDRVNYKHLKVEGGCGVCSMSPYKASAEYRLRRRGIHSLALTAVDAVIATREDVHCRFLFSTSIWLCWGARIGAAVHGQADKAAASLLSKGLVLRLPLNFVSRATSSTLWLGWHGRDKAASISGHWQIFSSHWSPNFLFIVFMLTHYLASSLEKKIW